MIGKASALVATFVAAAFMSGCAAPPMAAVPYDPTIRQGVVEQVTEVALQGPEHVGVGAVVLPGRPAPSAKARARLS